MPQCDALAQAAQRAEDQAREARGQAVTRGPQFIALRASVASQVGIEQRRQMEPWPCEQALRKGPHTIEHHLSLRLMEDRVMEAIQRVKFLVGRAQALEELALRPSLHHPVLAGAEDQRRHADRRCVLHHAFGRVIQINEDVRGDLAEDGLVLVVGALLLRIMREHAGFNITLYHTAGQQLLLHPQQRQGEGHIQFHVKGGRAQHQTTQTRRVVMHPGGRDHRPHAVRHEHDVLAHDGVGLLNVLNEGLQIADDHTQVLCAPTRARRLAMAALVPGEDSVVRHVQRLRQLHHATGVLVAAMQNHNSVPRLEVG